MGGNRRNILPKVHSSRQVMSTLINNGYTKYRIWPVSEMSPYLHSVLWPAIMIFSLPNLNVISIRHLLFTPNQSQSHPELPTNKVLRNSIIVLVEIPCP